MVANNVLVLRDGYRVVIEPIAVQAIEVARDGCRRRRRQRSHFHLVAFHTARGVCLSVSVCVCVCV